MPHSHPHPQYISSAQQNTCMAAFLNGFMYDDPENKARNSKAHVRITELNIQATTNDVQCSS